MFDNYKEYKRIVKSKNKVNLGNLKLNPTTVLPLLCDFKNLNLKLNNGQNAFNYLETKLNQDPLFAKLPKSRKENDFSDFITKYMDNLDYSYGGYFTLRTVISELANNVYDHSREKNEFVQSYIFSKLNSKSNKLEICVVDDGQSIPGLFEKSNVDFDNECQVIEKAISVFSTISDTPFERGNGFWTIIRLISEGNNGEILIISRKGCLHICGENYRYYLLSEKHIFNGTIVSVRLNKYEIQNIYDLIEFNKPNSYKLGVIYDY